jgi:hypothetical protein
MNQKLDMVLIGMLGDNFGNLKNDFQTLLKPTHIRSKSDEMLEIGVAQDAVSDTVADQYANAVIGDLLIPTPGRRPMRSRNLLSRCRARN